MTTPSAPRRHRRLPTILRFPEQAEALVSERRRALRTLLYFILKTMDGKHTIGCSQLVYWNAADPSRWLAPDAFVRLGALGALGATDATFAELAAWKTWERGAPEVAVEIAGVSDRSGLPWSEKLLRYRELGVQELVRFAPDEAQGERLRIWDRIEGDLVERVVEDDRSPCEPLRLHWAVAPGWDLPVTLRLAFDPDARNMLLTPEEALGCARDAEVRAAARARQVERGAREAAERRVAELTAALLRRGT